MNLTQKVINSAILAASVKVLSKVIGLVSTMVLARVLAPQEFGNIAIISIALYFFDILLHLLVRMNKLPVRLKTIRANLWSWVVM